MVLFEDALKIVLSQKFKIGTERVALTESMGRILAEDVFSDMDMPPFDKSAVDGYACRFTDVHNPMLSGTQNFISLQIIETIPAGTVPKKSVMTGECSRIMTGAMVPNGADCVVMVEDTQLTGENLISVTGEKNVKNICFRGEDIRKGDRVLQKGHSILAADVAVLASVGAVNPLVAKLPRVGIISTGDELVEPGFSPGLAQIRNSNGCQLEAQIKTVPAHSFYYGIAPDEGFELHKVVELAFENSDLVVLTGGVSMGDFDYIPQVLQEAGIEILFKSIAIQPGRPTVFGRRDKTCVFGLPGNPVSSFVLFEMMVRPFLRSMMGNSMEPVEFRLPAGIDFTRRKSERKSIIPVVIRNGAVFSVEYHGSAHINAYTIANGILTMEIGTTRINKGELVYVRPL